MMGVLEQPGVWGALALAGVGLVLSGVATAAGGTTVRGRLAAVARPVLPWVGLAVLAVLLAPGISDDLRLGLVGAILAVAGWFVTFLFQLDERETDQGDLMVALRAEIWVFWNDLTRNARADVSALVLAEAEADPDSAIFFPQPGPPVVFDANADQIARLPSEAVDEVVQFYSLLHAVRQFSVEMRDPVFVARPQAVRVEAYRAYFKNQADLAELATVAVTALNRALGLPPPDVSKPDPVQLALVATGGVDGGSRP